MFRCHNAWPEFLIDLTGNGDKQYPGQRQRQSFRTDEPWLKMSASSVWDIYLTIQRHKHSRKTLAPLGYQRAYPEFLIDSTGNADWKYPKQGRRQALQKTAPASTISPQRQSQHMFSDAYWYKSSKLAKLAEEWLVLNQRNAWRKRWSGKQKNGANVGLVTLSKTIICDQDCVVSQDHT